VVLKQQAIVDEAQAMFEKWDFERARLKEIYAGGRGTEKELNDVEKQHRAAERRLSAEKAELEQWKNGPRKEEIAKAKFEAAAQGAVVERLSREVERAAIRAPFDGFVVAKRSEIGEWVNAGFGSSAVAEMVAIETVRVRADVPEAAIPFARAGAGATIEIESLGRTLTAPIARVIPQAAAAARTFPVELDVANADHTLLPGMFVWTRVPSGPSGKRLMVSKDALVSHGTSKQVFVVRAPPPSPPGASSGPAGVPNGAPAAPTGPMAMPVAVTTGLEIGGEVEISGAEIRAGDRVVVRANERLMGPMPVIETPSRDEPASQQARK
jgi:membrane fusion protein (multidrug efflux system)